MIRIRGLRKRRVDWVVSREYWAGFFSCLAGNESDTWGLEYLSTSSLAEYNGVAVIAYRHGVADCLAWLRDRGTTRFPRHHNGVPPIPARVYAEAYGEARIACRPPRGC